MKKPDSNAVSITDVNTPKKTERTILKAIVSGKENTNREASERKKINDNVIDITQAEESLHTDNNQILKKNITEIEHGTLATAESESSELTHFDDALGPLQSISVNDHSEKYPSLFYAIPACLMYSLMDNNQIDIVARNAKQFGGVYFVLLYFIINFLVGFAPIELFVGIAQYTRAGMTKVFGLYARLFRCIGMGMLVTVFCFQSAALHRTADKLSFIVRNGGSPSKMVSCNYSEYNCMEEDHKNYYIACCTSVYHAVRCDNSSLDFTPSFANGLKCKFEQPGNVVLIPAVTLWEQIRERTLAFDLVFIIASVCIMLVIGLIALNGIVALAGFMAVSYIITTLAIIIYAIGVLWYGDLILGLSQFARLTEAHKLFQMPMLVDLTFMCFSMVALKFYILSIACYLHRQFHASKWSTIMYLKRTIIDILFLLVNLSMHGRFEKLNHISSTTIMKDVKQYARVIPEFFGTLSSFGFLFYLYYIVSVLMNIGQLAGPYFICYTFAKDHFPSKRKTVTITSICLLTLAHILISLIGDSRHVAIYGRHVVQSFWGSCFLVLAIFAIAFLYGPLELILDRYRIVRVTTRNIKQEILDKLSAYRIGLLRIVITPLLTLILLFGIAYVIMFTIMPDKDKNIIIHIVDVITILFPIIYFLIYQIHLHAKRKQHKIELQRLLFPTKNHPSYSRMLLGEPNTHDFQDVVLPNKRKTRGAQK